MSVSSSERAVNSPSSVDCERARNVERARRVSAERERRAGKHRYETTRWLTTGRGKVWDEASGAYRAVGVAAAVAVAGTFREVADARPGGGDRDDGLRRVSQDVVAPFVGGDGVHGQSVGPDRVRGLRLRLDAGHQDSQREHQRERVRGSTRHRALRYARHLSVREEAARCARDFHNRWRKAPHQRLFARRDYSSSESECTRELDDGVDTPHDTVLRALECTRARGRARSRCEGRRVATQTTRRRAERR